MKADEHKALQETVERLIAFLHQYHPITDTQASVIRTDMKMAFLLGAIDGNAEARR